MPERDYAAPLGHDHRESIFNKFRPSSIWGRKPALTPALRENFPDLLESHSPHDDIPPVPTIPDAFHRDHRAEGVYAQQHSRTDSAHLRPTTQAGQYYQRSESRPENPPTVPQRNSRELKTGQVGATSRLPQVRSRSPDWSFERPRVVPSPSTGTPPPTYHEHLNSTHRRDSNGRLFQIPNQPHFPTLEQAVRRQRKQPSLREQASQNKDPQPQGSSSVIGTDNTLTRSAAAQSSLRNEVSREHNPYIVEGSNNHVNTMTSITTNHNALPGRGGYIHFPSSLPTTEAHPLPQPPRSPPAPALPSSTHPHPQPSPRSHRPQVQAPQHPSTTEPQTSASPPPRASLDATELQELDDLLTPLPVPATPYAQHPTDRTESTTSVATSAATLGDRSSAARPLTFIEANFVGLASVVGFKGEQRKSRTERRSCSAKLAQYSTRITRSAWAVWRAQHEHRKVLRCVIDVLWSGEVKDCKCQICMIYLECPWNGGRRYHEVPKGSWRTTSPLDYHKLNWGVDADIRDFCDPAAPRRGLGAFRGGPDCQEVRYVTTRMDLDE